MPTPSSIRRLSPLPLLLIGLAALAVLVLIPWIVYAQEDPVNEESVTRLTSRPATTLVSNTGQSSVVTLNITQQYSMGFRLGSHGQGYEISSVSIDLAAAPSDLTVSLWIGGPSGSGVSGKSSVQRELFEFDNPASFKVGLNKFTAPAGAFAYQNVNYFIVLSDFGSSLSIKETTSDDEDAGGELGAILFNDARVRALGSTGRWSTFSSRGNVLRLAVEGSRRDRGILASNFTAGTNLQEIISANDICCFDMTVGAADRYLIRGVSVAADDSTSNGGFFGLPFNLSGGSNTFSLRYASAQGDLASGPLKLTSPPGMSEWEAPQGATVAGGCTTVADVETCKTYSFDMTIRSIAGDTQGSTRGGVVLSRIFCGAADDLVDSPSAPGVTLSTRGDVVCKSPVMAVDGEPLVAMVQNLGQSDDGYVQLRGTNRVASQGFTTGSNPAGYRLQGIGVNIEGSDNVDGDPQVPSGPTSVSVAVYSESNGKPGAKLFDLVSPTNFGAGHSFFEAPAGTTLAADTSYVLVWRYNDSVFHRLQATLGDNEDSGALTGFSIADAFYQGADLSSLGMTSAGHALEIAVYGKVAKDHGYAVTKKWLHIPEDVEVGYQFRVVFVTIRGLLPTSRDIEDYDTWVQEEAARGYNHIRIREVSSEFKAVVCTATVDARTNTGMTDVVGVPVHWLDGGWQDQPTLIADTYDDFYGGTWVNHDWGAYSTGNRAYFYDYGMVATGCDASGAAHPQFPMGNTSTMDMVAVGTPKGRSLETREDDADPNFAPLGAIDVVSGFAYQKYYVVFEDLFDGKKQERLVRLYAISPIFTVVR